MAITSYQTLSAVDQKPESIVPDDQKKATSTSKQPRGHPSSPQSDVPSDEKAEEEPQAAETTTMYDPYQAYYANYYGGYPGYGYGGYPGYGYGQGYGS